MKCKKCKIKKEFIDVWELTPYCSEKCMDKDYNEV